MKVNIQNTRKIVKNMGQEFLINVPFSTQNYKEFSQNRDLSLYKYVKKYQSQYLNSLNKHDVNASHKINAMLFANLNNKLKEVIKKNKGCQQIVKEELPITPGFYYGDDRMTIYYLLNILEIKENFENIKQYSLNTDKEKIYYHCWY